MPKRERYDVVVVGGGFFGCRLATAFAGEGGRVLLLEREADIMLRASQNNQARVHHEYHYPRHFLTTWRSRVNYPRFVKEYEAFVVDSFEKVYAISRRFSKTTASSTIGRWRPCSRPRSAPSTPRACARWCERSWRRPASSGFPTPS